MKAETSLLLILAAMFAPIKAVRDGASAAEPVLKTNNFIAGAYDTPITFNTNFYISDLMITNALLLYTSDSVLQSVSSAWTNRVTNDLSILSAQAVPGRCPECGGLNHHERETVLSSAHDEIFVNVVSRSGRTNTVLVECGPTNRFLHTNIVLHVTAPMYPPLHR